MAATPAATPRMTRALDAGGTEARSMPGCLAPPRLRACPSRSDHRLHAPAGGGVGERRLDALERKPRGDQRLDGERRHQRERAAEGAAAAECAVDRDLAEV